MRRVAFLIPSLVVLLAAPASGRGFSDPVPLAPGPAPLTRPVLVPGASDAPVTVSGGRIRYLVRPRRVRRGSRTPFVRRVGTLADLERARRSRRNRWAEPAYPTRAVRTPNDPLLTRQGNAFLASGTDGFRAAWEVTDGAPVVGGTPPVIAVVDSGVDFTHPDLAQSPWTNPGEIAGNGIDDDRNGYVDDVHGADLVDRGTPPDDEFWHGTAVAGIAAARDDNGEGIAGVAGAARVMAVRALGADGTGDTSLLAEGIRYAVRNGADVVNCSMTTDMDTKAVDDAIAEAGRAGVLVVAAAGNSARDLAAAPAYPASSDDPAVVSVAALQDRGVLADFSNFGRTAVDVAAPGVSLLTTVPDAAYAGFSGTSAAAPVVTGTIALERAAQPQASAQELKRVLLATADRTGVPVRSGDLRAGLAVGTLAPTDTPATAPAPQAQQAQQAATVVVRATVHRIGTRGRRRLLRVSWTVNRAPEPVSGAVVTVRRGSARGRLLARRTTTGARISARTSPVAGGSHDLWVQVRVSGVAGRSLGTGLRVVGLR